MDLPSHSIYSMGKFLYSYQKGTYWVNRNAGWIFQDHFCSHIPYPGRI